MEATIPRMKPDRHQSASEVVRAALRALDREERKFKMKLAALRTAIDEGDASGVADKNVFARIRSSLGFTCCSR
jgi:putative addiction module CopG family antidote